MPEKIFDNFQEFFSLTRPMNEIQKDIIIKCLSDSEVKTLLKAKKEEGWEDLFIQNEIDEIIDQIKEEFNEDLIYLRIRVLSGHICKIRKAFWKYINDVFSIFPIKHTNHIFKGLSIKEYDQDWVLLVPTKWSKNEQKKDFDF
jgi:hypothetical protein